MNDQETTVSAMKGFVQAFVDERDWQQFHDPKNLSMSIAIEAAELMEHFQWLRSDQLRDLKGDPEAMAHVEEELADVFCYVLAFAGAMGIDLCASLDSKMVKNREKYPVERFKGKF
ncbi:MAG: nucleotide pyrophosphohydrolase [Planctomycetes bacterium]|nr:nucleotide pyrophosphohydrolase [Planctomycetota bacterium]